MFALVRIIILTIKEFSHAFIKETPLLLVLIKEQLHYDENDQVIKEFLKRR